jgi:uncharacterized protein
MNIVPSVYNFYIELNDKNYVYNILSTSISQVNKNIYFALKNNNLEEIINSEYLTTLIDNNFIVNTDSNEYEEYFYFYNRTRFGISSTSLTVTIIPTYNCNLACKYCYEGQEKAEKKMNTTSVNNIQKFIERKIIESIESDIEIKKLIFRMFGGEPMLAKDIITKFCRETSEIADKYNLPAIYDMSSNLTLLDDDYIELIRKYKISIQVSIDGIKSKHDTRRITKNNSGSYDIICKNLKKLNTAGLKENIVIRLNIDKDNLNDAEQCLDDIHKYSNYIYYGMLHEYKGYNDKFSQCITCDSYSNILTTSLNNYLKKYGYSVPMTFGKESPCTINAENKFYIDPCLNVYKCELFVNKPECSVGTISDEGEFIPNKNFFHQMNYSPQNFTECISCKLLPLCASGCPAQKYLDSGDKNCRFTEKNCVYTENDLSLYLKYYIEDLSQKL